jgi:hypothetical protein
VATPSKVFQLCALSRQSHVFAAAAFCVPLASPALCSDCSAGHVYASWLAAAHVLQLAPCFSTGGGCPAVQATSQPSGSAPASLTRQHCSYNSWGHCPQQQRLLPCSSCTWWQRAASPGMLTQGPSTDGPRKGAPRVGALCPGWRLGAVLPSGVCIRPRRTTSRIAKPSIADVLSRLSAGSSGEQWVTAAPGNDCLPCTSRVRCTPAPAGSDALLHQQGQMHWPAPAGL